MEPPRSSSRNLVLVVRGLVLIRLRLLVIVRVRGHDRGGAGQGIDRVVPGQPHELRLGVPGLQMRVDVQRELDGAVAHDDLERLRVHPGGAVGAERMPADVRGNIRQRLPVDLVELGDCPAQVVLPVLRHFDPAVLVQPEEARRAFRMLLAPHDLLFRKLRPAVNHLMEHGLDVRQHRHDARAVLRLGLLDVIEHPVSVMDTDQLPPDTDDMVLEVYIVRRQTAELGDAEARVEQDVDAVEVPAEMLICPEKVQNAPHVGLADGVAGPGPAVPLGEHREIEGIVQRPAVALRHGERRAKDAPERMQGAVALALLVVEGLQPFLGLRRIDGLDLTLAHRVGFHEAQGRPIAVPSGFAHVLPLQVRVALHQVIDGLIAPDGVKAADHFIQDRVFALPKGFALLLHPALGDRIVLGKRMGIN